LNRLAKIEHKIDSLDQTTAFALRADADRHFAEVKKIFGKSLRRAQVYLATNGIRGVQEIAEHLAMQRQNVGIELRALKEEGLLEIIDTHKGKDIWSKKPIDRTLRITKFLRREFKVGPDGLLPTTNINQSESRKPKKA
jgi:DNA-binding transcriptional ArsR family regulator